MWLQAKKTKKIASRFSICSPRRGRLDKKGVSIMIGYVLLVTSAIVMGVLVYQWIKTYVPKDAVDCPEGVSIFVKDYEYDCNNSELSLTLKNNGVFKTAGYFIYAANKTEQEVASIDLSKYTLLGKDKGGTVLFDTKNSFKPNDEKTDIYFLNDSGIGQIYSLEIIPVRFQEENNKIRFVSCGNSKIKEIINCKSEGEVAENCGDGTCDPGECSAGCTEDCNINDCCGIGGCNPEIGETCSTCPTDCGECPTGERVQIEYIGFESTNDINNWVEDSNQPFYGETLTISDSDECDPKSGNYMLSATGDFDPNLVRYNRILPIDVTNYQDILIKYSMSSEDTETQDRIEFYYYTGSSWKKCHGTVNRDYSGCAGWEDFECSVILDSGETELFIGIGWETSSLEEHAFWDDINITGFAS